MLKWCTKQLLLVTAIQPHCLKADFCDYQPKVSYPSLLLFFFPHFIVPPRNTKEDSLFPRNNLLDIKKGQNFENLKLQNQILVWKIITENVLKKS